MKHTVILTPSEPTVHLNDADTSSKFYGAQRNGTKDVGYIARTTLMGRFRLVQNLSTGNSYSFYGDNNTLEILVRKLINDGWTVFQFDKMSELALWVEEND